MSSKLLEFYAAVSMNEYDAIVIVETWLNSSHLDAEVAPTGWSIFRKDRFGRGGGVMILCKDHFRPTLVPVDCRGTEQVWVKANLPGNNVYIGAAYVPPCAQVEVLSNATNVFADIEKLLHDDEEALLLSDFNQPGITWIRDYEIPNVFRPVTAASETEVLLVEGLLGQNLYQLNETTNSYGNLMETVFSTCYDNIQLTCPAPPLCRR